MNKLTDEQFAEALAKSHELAGDSRQLHNILDAIAEGRKNGLSPDEVLQAFIDYCKEEKEIDLPRLGSMITAQCKYCGETFQALFPADNIPEGAIFSCGCNLIKHKQAVEHNKKLLNK